jgi:hypothetical protein
MAVYKSIESVLDSFAAGISAIEFIKVLNERFKIRMIWRLTINDLNHEWLVKKQFTATSIVEAPTLKTPLVTSNQKSCQPGSIDYYQWKPGCQESLDPKFTAPGGQVFEYEFDVRFCKENPSALLRFVISEQPYLTDWFLVQPTSKQIV